MTSSPQPAVLQGLASLNLGANQEAGLPAVVQAMDWHPTGSEPILVKQYLWKHPNRAGRVTLYTGEKGNVVTFAHITDGVPVEDCKPHGSWELSEKLLKISFNHQAKIGELENHTFVRHDPSADVWYLTGIFEGWNARSFAFLQPWNQEHGN